MSKIFYNNFLVGSGQPDPLVTRAISPYNMPDGRRIGLTDVYTLVGQITGCQFSDITGFQGYLNNIFSKDFGTLKLQDDDGYVAVISGCRVNSINYEQGIMVGLQGYNVELSAFPQNYFTSAGILEKRNDWNVTQEANQNLSITHEIFAKGVNTAPSFSNAFDNAKNFVLLYTGFSPPTLFPFFISGFSGSLDSRTETINRLEGTYQINETYVGRTGSAISQDLTVNLDRRDDGIISVAVNGTFRNGKGQNFSGLRQQYSGFNAFDLASGVYADYGGPLVLQQTPASKGVSENLGENSLTFDYEYNDWPTVSYKHSYDIQLTLGSNDFVTASINGSIEGLGRLGQRYTNANAFFATLVPYNLVNAEYTTTYPTSPTLRNVVLQSSVTDNTLEGTINYSYSYDNKVLDSRIKSFEASVSKQSAVTAYSSVSIPDSVQGLDVVNLGYAKRATISVQGSATAANGYTSATARSFLLQYVNGTFPAEYLASKSNINLESAVISENVQNNSASFSASYSFTEVAGNLAF